MSDEKFTTSALPPNVQKAVFVPIGIYTIFYTKDPKALPGMGVHFAAFNPSTGESLSGDAVPDGFFTSPEE